MFRNANDASKVESKEAPVVFTLPLHETPHLKEVALEHMSAIVESIKEFKEDKQKLYSSALGIMLTLLAFGKRSLSFVKLNDVFKNKTQLWKQTQSRWHKIRRLLQSLNANWKICVDLPNQTSIESIRLLWIFTIFNRLSIAFNQLLNHSERGDS